MFQIVVTYNSSNKFGNELKNFGKKCAKCNETLAHFFCCIMFYAIIFFSWCFSI